MDVELDTNSVGPGVHGTEVTLACAQMAASVQLRGSATAHELRVAVSGEEGLDFGAVRTGEKVSSRLMITSQVRRDGEALFWLRPVKPAELGWQALWSILLGCTGLLYWVGQPFCKDRPSADHSRANTRFGFTLAGPCAGAAQCSNHSEGTKSCGGCVTRLRNHSSAAL